jgi:hypothetical protein
MFLSEHVFLDFTLSVASACSKVISWLKISCTEISLDTLNAPTTLSGVWFLGRPFVLIVAHGFCFILKI